MLYKFLSAQLGVRLIFVDKLGKCDAGGVTRRVSNRNGLVCIARWNEWRRKELFCTFFLAMRDVTLGADTIRVFGVGRNMLLLQISLYGITDYGRELPLMIELIAQDHGIVKLT